MTITLNNILLAIAALLAGIAWFISTGYNEDGWTDPSPWAYAAIAFVALGLIAWKRDTRQ